MVPEVAIIGVKKHTDFTAWEKFAFSLKTNFVFVVFVLFFEGLD